MKPKTLVTILNIRIHNTTLENLLAEFNDGLLVTPNVDHLVKLQKNKDFYNAYKSARWVICDSTIVSACLRFLGTPIKQVIPGSSFLPSYYMYHRNNPDVRIFLLGAAPGVAKQAMENINKRTGSSIIVGAHSPSFGFENNHAECEEILRIINETDATVLVVGVGAPKQELWICRYRNRLTKVRSFLALGATIDFEAGVLRRAPILFQRLRTEWLFRLCKEPRRLWRRYLIEDPPFLLLLIRQRLGIYTDPFAEKSITDD